MWSVRTRAGVTHAIYLPRGRRGCGGGRGAAGAAPGTSPGSRAAACCTACAASRRLCPPPRRRPPRLARGRTARAPAGGSPPLGCHVHVRVWTVKAKHTGAACPTDSLQQADGPEEFPVDEELKRLHAVHIQAKRVLAPHHGPPAVILGLLGEARYQSLRRAR